MPESKQEKETEGRCLPCRGVQTDNWHAWNDLMPPAPFEFHIVGDVQVPNPGVEPLLAYRSPQGINPAYLLLDLHLMQRPGVWPQVVVTKQVRYGRVLTGGAKYVEADIFCGDEIIVRVSVQDAH